MGQYDHRHRGILLPVFSLPSRTGIGCFSREAYAFVDFLQEAGQDAWQILPLGPIDVWCSPYQPCSAFAGEALYIDPETLADQGLLTREELDEFCTAAGVPTDGQAEPTGVQRDQAVSYETVIPAKDALLRRAYERFILNSSTDEDGMDALAGFREDNRDWLDDYCLFAALHRQCDGRPWTEWEHELASREPAALQRARRELDGEIGYIAWQQYEFSRQWQALRAYAHDRGIRIIGDMPYYMTLDSVECWKDPELFQLDENYRPRVISGVPGDKFNSAGQIWNSPVYNWKDMPEQVTAWWQQRIRRSFVFYDVIRLDHARAFASCYAIPADHPDPACGGWEQASGAKVFAPFEREIAEGRLIAEDLGTITDDVRQMMREARLPGMAVLQFAFDSGPDNPYRPANIRPETVVYTGTHDNAPTVSWYRNLRGRRRWRVKRYFRRAVRRRLADMRTQSRPASANRQSGRATADMHMRIGPSSADSVGAVSKTTRQIKRARALTYAMIRAALDSPAQLAVIPLQDYLGLGDEARINTPGTTGDNWTWRMDAAWLTPELAEEIRRY